MDITVVPALQALTREEDAAVIRRAWEAVGKEIGEKERDRLRQALNADQTTGWTADSNIAMYKENVGAGTWGVKALTELHKRLVSRNGSLLDNQAWATRLDAAMRAEISGLNIQAMALADKISEAQAAIAQALAIIEAMKGNAASTDRPDPLTTFACHFGTSWAMAGLSLSGDKKGDRFQSVIRAIAESVEGKSSVTADRLGRAVCEAGAWVAAMEKIPST